MDLPGLDLRPGKVVEAEILRRYNTLVSFDPRLSPRAFFLVLSIGRCKFRLSKKSVSLILQFVIGGQPNDFPVLSLGDRVFRFSIHSQEVGFHIYQLRAFECANFKIYFHLWHGGGPNFWYEYNLWLQEQSLQWVEVVRKPSKPENLSGANLEPLGTRRVHRPFFQNQTIVNPARQSVFMCIKPALTQSLNPALKDILGPYPARLHLGIGPVTSQLRYDGPAYQSCGQFGHQSGRCSFPPRLPRHTGNVAPASGDLLGGPSMPSGPVTGYKTPFFSSFSDYAQDRLHLSPPPPLIIPWCRTWKLTVPEFEDNPQSPSSSAAGTGPHHPPVFSSFGEFAQAQLGLNTLPTSIHVAWNVKTPITVAPSHSSTQEKMAFRFVDPQPFLPEGAQRLMVQGRPLMQRVVTGRVQRQHNDLAIATFNPLPLEQLIDFDTIRNVLIDFLSVQHAFPYEAIQPCPFGQAYVKFTYIHQRDLLIQNNPIPYGNGPITFIPHDRDWNNKTAIMTHDVWMYLLVLIWIFGHML